MSDPVDRVVEEPKNSIENEGFPSWVDPMLATLVDEAFSDEDWIFERKLDGERCLVYRHEGQVRLMSRNEKKLNNAYPEIVEWFEDNPGNDIVIDGELVAFDGDVTSFQKLQPRMQIDDPEEARQSDVSVYYYVFDILHLDGQKTRDLPLRQRKEILRTALRFDDPVRFTQHRNTDGEDYYDEACADGWEGLIAKDATAPYVTSRSRKWLKFKCVNRQEFVVGGFTEPEGERTDFGALLIGYYEKDRLTYAGKVGTGYDDETLNRLGKKMRDLERDDPPFDEDGLPPDAHWIEPELVAEVGFTEWTSAGKLRHPRYIGLRDDKAPEEVVRESGP